jgi:hypothetical protein
MREEYPIKRATVLTGRVWALLHAVSKTRGIFNLYKTSGKTKNKIGGRRLEVHIADPTNKRMEHTSRRQKRMEASSEGAQGPEDVVVP